MLPERALVRQKGFDRIQRKRDLISFGTRCSKECADIQPVDRIDIIVMKTVHSAGKAAGELRGHRSEDRKAEPRVHPPEKSVRKRGINRVRNLQ